MVTETGVTSADTNSLSQIDDLINGARSVNAKAVMYFDSNQWALTSGHRDARRYIKQSCQPDSTSEFGLKQVPRIIAALDEMTCPAPNATPRKTCAWEADDRAAFSRSSFKFA